MTTPTLETNRIILRPPSVDDALTAFNNWTSDPDVAKFVRWNTHETIDTTVEWLTYEVENIPKDNYFGWVFVLKETGEAFGSGSVFFNDEVNLFEIGFCIMKKCWGLGLTTEAGKAMVDFAFNELKQTTLYVRHAKENIGSGKVIEKLGFVYQGDGEYSSLDGKETFECRDYLLTAQNPKCPNVPVCPCPKTDCPNHSKCCSCVIKHRESGNLPFCLRE
ncbi:MAG: GNAT family N-acetyltransferase [Oscillospiraceae bacterium]|nr:GNAT family N-acetyltransferase [Oscillospiraceae bacterium]